jgi:VWFA-related protein
VALVFDDLHLKICGPDPPPGYIGCSSDLVYIRDAGQKYIDGLKPADRVAIFTTSGQVTLDFTSDRAKLREAILKLTSGAPVLQTVNGSGLADNAVEWETRAVVTQSGDIVRRMATLPGQRTIVLMSPGMMLESASAKTWTFVPDTMHLIDSAIRSRVVINSLDARGLTYERAGTFHEFMFRVTDGTGGKFIRDTNDLNGGLEQLAATPKYIYVLGFSPQTLKPDGSFHTLSVKLLTGHKLDLQARKGYWAPDAKELARKQNEPVSAKTADAPRVSETETKEVAEELGIAVATAKPPELPEAALVTAPAPEPAKAPAAVPEIATEDQPVTFKAQSNLVEVPVVVRDREGHAIGNLRKDDFRLFDKGKRQDITKFSVQKAAAAADAVAPESHAAGASTAAVAPPPLPGHFIAFVFDDVHIQFADLPQVRDAVRRYLSSSLQPGDRVALFTTSGKIAVDFTDKPAVLDEALLKIRPSPFTASALRSCLYISYFQAVQIDQQVSLHPVYPDDIARSVALKTAVYDVGRCLQLSDPMSTFDAAVQEARDAFLNGKQESRADLATLSNIVRRMAVMPGHRRIVLASPGFFVSPELQDQGSDLIALAIRSKVLISTIDARGVWTSSVYDASQPGSGGPPPADVITFKETDGTVADDELVALAEGTGGTANFNNDFDGGVRKAAAAPEYLYVLGFVPQNLKLDGSFHTLKVTLNSGEKASLQVRRGYWAPKHAEDAGALSKQEIEDAVFSRDEIHNLPVELHTQVTGSGDEAKLNVLTSVDLKLIHLRKADDRNRNDLTIVATVFDPNGNFVAGAQKILQLRLRDATVQGLDQKPPVTIPTKFDMKTGAYLVRLVVRDAEGQQLTAENAAVQIP